MYDMYPDYTQQDTDSHPFSERGMSGLGHCENYPIFVKPVTEHPAYPRGYEYVAAAPLAATVELTPVASTEAQ